MTQLTLENLSKTYANSDTNAVHALSLSVNSGEIVALLGPSGSGKSTTLKLIAGLLTPSAGDIRFDGQSVVNIPAEKRSAVMVFQDHLLFPYLSVAENVAFGLKVRGVNRSTRLARAHTMLERVRLPNVGNRRPSQLSGGQQQRVALARALITEPRLLLLDEPLSSLDVHLRDEMRDLILNVQREFGITTLLVTHDQQEAVLMADRIALMFDGRLQQYDTPTAFYHAPHDERIARFFGGVNFLQATFQAGGAHTALGWLSLVQSTPNGTGTLTIRPEHITLNAPATAPNRLRAAVVRTQYAGTHTRYTLRIEQTLLEALRSGDPAELTVGAAVDIALPPASLWRLPR